MAADKEVESAPQSAATDALGKGPLALGLLLLAGAGWAYWPTGVRLVEGWCYDPQYSHGFLIPPIAAALLWQRRHDLAGLTWETSGWAVPLALLAGALLALGGRYEFPWLSAVSLLPMLAAICLAVGGRPLLRGVWPAILFLVFMVPLPGRLQGLLARPLQRMAANASTHLLQTLGFPAQADGSVILLNEVELEVVDACNGIRMLVAFVALSTAVAALLVRPWYQRLLLLSSAVPIALVCNVLRITTAGVLYETAGSSTAHFVYHDLAGWLMIPLALGFLLLELWYLDHLVVTPLPALNKE
jgi:exosortase